MQLLSLQMFTKGLNFATVYVFQVLRSFSWVILYIFVIGSVVLRNWYHLYNYWNYNTLRKFLSFSSSFKLSGWNSLSQEASDHLCYKL